MSQHVTEARRPDVVKLLEHLRDKTDFFQTPASSRANLHMACYGGLAVHCMNMALVFLAQVEMLFGENRIKGLVWGGPVDKSMDIARLRESAVIISLCHDLNKVKLWGRCYYTPNILKTTKKPSDTQPYNKAEGRVALGSTEQVMLTTTFINPKADEIQAIRYAEGLYDRSTMSDIGNREELLTFLSHFADMISAQIVEWPEGWKRDHTQWRDAITGPEHVEEKVEVEIQATLPL